MLLHHPRQLQVALDVIGVECSLSRIVVQLRQKRVGLGYLLVLDAYFQ
jgi:hypothetical protein